MAILRLLVALCVFSLITGVLADLEGCQSEIDLVFAFDSSESIKMYPSGWTTARIWGNILDLARGIVANLPIGLAPGQAQVAAVRFTTTAKVMFYLDRYQNSLEAQFAIKAIPVDMGNTDISTALNIISNDVYTTTRGMRTQASTRKVVVLFTDGFSTVNPSVLAGTNSKLKSTLKAEVFVVTVGDDYNWDGIRNLASSPLSKYFINAPSYGQLVNNAFLQLLSGICNVTQIPNPPPTPPPPSPKCMLHCASCKDETTCEVCEVGWYWNSSANLCQACSVIMDMCFVVDNSGSITDPERGGRTENYELIKSFVKTIVSRLNINGRTVRVGLLRFSTSTYVQFYLDNDYDSPEAINSAIQNIGYEGGWTHTWEGLNKMRTVIFQTSYGDRPKVPNVAIVITDGQSDNTTSTLQESNLAKSSNITMFVVGISDMINEAELKAMASEPLSQRYFNSVDESHLNLLINDLITFVCNPSNAHGG